MAMKPHPITTFALLLLLSLSTGSAAQNPDRRDKVVEGEYWRWENGHPIKNTAQSWAIWRTKDGFEIENKLPPDKAALWFAAMGQVSATREFKEEVKNAAMVTDVTIQADQEFHLVALRSNGKSLKDGKPVVVADCSAKEAGLACKGRLGDVRTALPAAASPLYSPAGPMQYVLVLKQVKVELSQSQGISLVMLEEVKNRLQLSEVKVVVRSEGRDKLTIGERVIELEKFVVSIDAKNTPWQISLWASKQGVVFGVEDSRDPEARVLLTQYKKYSDF